MKIEIDLTEKPNLAKRLQQQAKEKGRRLENVVTEALYAHFGLKPEYRTYIHPEFGVRVIELPGPLLPSPRRKRKPKE